MGVMVLDVGLRVAGLLLELSLSNFILLSWSNLVNSWSRLNLARRGKFSSKVFVKLSVVVGGLKSIVFTVLGLMVVSCLGLGSDLGLTVGSNLVLCSITSGSNLRAGLGVVLLVVIRLGAAVCNLRGADLKVVSWEL